MRYKQQRNRRTGETRWVPVMGSENVVDKINDIPIVGAVTKPITKVIQGGVEKTNNIPIIGPLMGTASTIGSSLGTMLSVNKMDKLTQENMAKNRELVQRARIESDPALKQELLNKARTITQSGNERVSGWGETINKTNLYAGRKSPNTIPDRLKTYAPQAVRTGLAGGELASLFMGVPSGVTAKATTHVGKIVTSILTGGSIGGLSGLSEGEEIPLEERIKKGEKSAIVGAVLAGLLQTGNEARKGIVNKLKKEPDTFIKVLNNIKDKTNLFKNTSKKIASEVDSLAKDSINVIDYGKVKDEIRKQVMKRESGTLRKSILKNLDLENDGPMSIWDALQKKRGTGFAPNSRASTAKFNEYLRIALTKKIHTLEPEIAAKDAIYSFWKGLESGTQKATKGLPFAGGVAGAGFILNKLFNKK